MSARDDLLQLDGSDEWPAKVDAILAKHRNEVLALEAADVVRFCPEHSDHYASYMDCHCAVADVLRQRAAKANTSPAAVPVPDETGGDETGEVETVHPSSSLGALIESALVESKPVWWQTPPRLDWAATAVIAAMAEDAKALLAEQDETAGDETGEGFFQPGRTYQRRRWLFQCLAVAPNPFDQETRAVGFLFRPGEPATATALDQDNWEHDGWTEVADATKAGDQS